MKLLSTSRGAFRGFPSIFLFVPNIVKYCIQADNPDCDVPCTWEAELLGGMLPVPELVCGGGAGGGGRGEVGARLRVAQPPGPGAHNLQQNEIFFKNVLIGFKNIFNFWAIFNDEIRAIEI